MKTTELTQIETRDLLTRRDRFAVEIIRTEKRIGRAPTVYFLDYVELGRRTANAFDSENNFSADYGRNYGLTRQAEIARRARLASDRADYYHGEEN